MPEDLRGRWHALWGRRRRTQRPAASAEDADRVWGFLQTRYGEPHRAYHTLAHLRHCFQELDASEQPPADHDVLSLALWFHDVVYDPRETRPGGNETESARAADRVLPEASLTGVERASLRGLILATAHGQAKASTDTAGLEDRALLIDIDLSILGQPRPRYAAYREQIRREYRHATDADYRRGRSAVIQSFLASETVYSTAAFQRRYEAAARQNLESELANLSD